MELSKLIIPLLHNMPPEHAHRFAMSALAGGFVPKQKPVHKPVTVGSLSFRNPVGMAAGFDKNGEAVAGLFNQGFGFVECGTVTPKPQSGNPKPRLFRLSEDEAIINRMGFPNKGLSTFKRNLWLRTGHIRAAQEDGAKLGINIGKNKDSEDALADYVTLLQAVAEYADYVTVNISSPNTPGLRDLQTAEALHPFLEGLCKARDALEKPVPLWLKLAPDLEDAECEAIGRVVLEHPIEALVISNTTVSRPAGLKSADKHQAGGLSGKPLMVLSTDRLRLFHQVTEGKMPLVGVGGITSPEDAKAKMAAGASLVQLYSALIYQGFGLVPRIAEAL
ncbi:MAG: quinone-dependent dihydroorotate dehydrogenase [Rickettsiales bacterium]